MKNALIKLLKVKSIMTIAVLTVFVILALTRQISDELTTSVITAVITYYFAKKENKEE